MEILNKVWNWICNEYSKNPSNTKGMILVMLLAVLFTCFNWNPLYFFTLLLGWVLGDFWRLCDKVNSLEKNNKKEILND